MSDPTVAEPTCPACGNKLNSEGDCPNYEYCTAKNELVPATVKVAIYDEIIFGDHDDEPMWDTWNVPFVRTPEGKTLLPGMKVLADATDVDKYFDHPFLNALDGAQRDAAIAEVTADLNLCFSLLDYFVEEARPYFEDVPTSTYDPETKAAMPNRATVVIDGILKAQVFFVGTTPADAVEGPMWDDDEDALEYVEDHDDPDSVRVYGAFIEIPIADLRPFK